MQDHDQSENTLCVNQFICAVIVPAGCYHVITMQGETKNPKHITLQFFSLSVCSRVQFELWPLADIHA